ncbi:extracellular solute-binding protein [Clostridium sp. MCC353]|uniref:ABC transporter substrate-binding protein n=1 Tax=Clostridium sp. MCC353 TaxID=2592646 RepID=UPI001C022552|nr:extracellular solute-binding protein [Clostridium sp. MCC353]MBT9776115.1 extracellular solute-binding protein [Clostridium sp. MCC353]
MKKLLALALASGMLVSGITGCGGKQEAAPATTAAGAAGSEAAKETPKETAKTASKDREVIEFWFHAADEKNNEIYEAVFEEFNNSQDKYEARYTGFANKDFPDKFAMAIATNTMPDVVSLGFSNVMTYVAQDALIDVNDYFEGWEDKSKIAPSMVETLKELGGGKLYGVPYNYNQEISWYNTKFFEENGIEVPKTQKEFLALCEKYANPDEGTYFYSLRGVKPYDNLLGWIFTYADGGGYNGSYFDENGNCIINKPEFVEALDLYASIYKNGWVSGDCVNNGFNEMVAEFGSQTAMYIMHNSSSRSSHMSNLGDGNFDAAKALANDEGRYYTSAIQPQLYAVTNTKGEDADYTGAFELCKYLSSASTVEKISKNLGRIPVNSDNYENQWFKEDKFMPLYQEIMTDENFIQIQNPYWLTSYFNFINNDMTADFQAVLLGDMTSQEALDRWADFLTKEQAAYKQNQ